MATCQEMSRSIAKMSRNLLKNPHGDAGLKFWELTKNGGNEWRVEHMSGDCAHAFINKDVTKYFTTSFELCLKKQVIDLVAEGYDPGDLNNQPAVTIEDWFCSRTDCGCVYQLSVSLLDAKRRVLQEYKPDRVIIDPDRDDCSWRQVTKTFTDYGPGLRFISFEHGGKDTKFWRGWYGVRVTRSSVTIDHTNLQINNKMLRNLLKNPNGDEGFTFWELTKNGGNEWRVEHMPGDCGHAFVNKDVTKYFTTSFQLCLKKQMIDLVAEGYDPRDLNSQPAVTIEDWFCSRTDCGCVYQLSVSLLDAKRRVLQEYKPDRVIIDPDRDDCSWRQVTKTFTDYGQGLRFISFEHGGEDTKFWRGWYGVRVTRSSVTIDHTNLLINKKMSRNLLKNPNGDEGFTFWELTKNGGNEWRVEHMPGDCGHAFVNNYVTKYFTTSFQLCLKKQMIDLVAEGYDPRDLNSQPAVTIEDWFCSRTDCGCVYQLSVSLLDAKRRVLQEYKPDRVIIDPDREDCSWRQVTKTFSDYGPGLRFISFEHGGKDTKFWRGWFGVRVTSSSVTIDFSKKTRRENTWMYLMRLAL